MAFNSPLVDDEIPSSAKWNTAVAAYDRSTSTVDVVSSAALTSVYSKAIGAGHMSSDRMLRLTLIGDYLNNSGANRTLLLQILLGSTVVYEYTTNGFAADADRRHVELDLVIANLGVANSQRIAGRLNVSDPVAATAGIGTLDTTFVGQTGGAIGVDRILTHPFGSSALAIDTALAATLEVKVQHPASNAGLSFRKLYALLELL